MGEIAMKHLIFVLVLLSLALAAIGDESLTGSVVVGVSYEFKSIDGGKTLRDNGAVSLSQNFSYGNSTSAAQINGRYSLMMGLKSDTETVIDTMNLTDSFGNMLEFSSAKGVIVRNHSLVASVMVGSSTESDLLPTITLPPGGAMTLVAPYGGWTTAGRNAIHLTSDDVASCEIAILGITP